MAKKYNKKDVYHNKAKDDGFAARSVYKLEEIQKRIKFIKPHMKVIDFGCAPGSWLQYVSRIIGPKGFIVGYDLDDLEITLKSNIAFYKYDFLKLEMDDISLTKHFDLPADLVLSDAMVNTSGIADADCIRSVELNESILQLIKKGLLKPEGDFLFKIFEGVGYQDFLLSLKKSFKKVKGFKPKAIRPGSREQYVYCQGFKDFN